MRTLTLILTLLASTCSADISVEVKPAVVSQITTPQVQTQLFVGGFAVGTPVQTEGESTESVKPAKSIVVTADEATPLDQCLVKLLCETATTKEAVKGIYLIDEPGTHVVWVNVIHVETLQWYDKKVTVTVGEPPPDPDNPDPDPQPDPDVPEDEFDNIGQRVAGWAKDLEKAPEIGQVYATAAEQLRTAPTATIDSVTAEMSTKLKTLDCESLCEKINTDLAERWPLSRGVLADYYAAIAAGLGVTQ